MNIAICGGTFNPFHRGHLDPILAVRDAMRWDRVLYIPAHVQPFKRDQQSVSGYHRFAMTVLGTEGHGGLYVSPRELERGAVSYTVDTLQELRGEHPEDTFDWVIGSDNLTDLMKWKSIDTIFSLANFVVLHREGEDVLPPMLEPRRKPAEEREHAGSIVFAANPAVPISSTDIRRRVGAGESIDDLVDSRVARYIHHYGLYRKGQT